MENKNPCKVCGGTELNLVDGYYYCVECGTQDTNVRETIVEQTLLADGTFAHGLSKKFNTTVKDGVEMSGEWYKWHTYNFIMAGLTEQLISLGAAPSVKLKVLWIWTRYIKKYQIKEDLGKTNKQEENTFIIDDTKTKKVDTSDEEICGREPNTNARIVDIKTMTKRTFLAILYAALNLDHSHIQLSHLFRFIKEGKLNIDHCTVFIPKEMNTKTIPNWFNFISCSPSYSKHHVRYCTMTFFKRLDLGLPVVPNLTDMIDNYIQELCLPLDFRDLVLSLTHLMPCDFLQLDESSMKYIVRLPDYEEVCMCYIIIGLKICFGLDDDYEIRLSNAVDDINENNNYSKSYKLGFTPEPSNRLFSFRDWYKYLQFRKGLLSKYHLNSAQLYNLPIDDYSLIEQIDKSTKTKSIFSDKVAMDILNKIEEDDVPKVMSKKDFPTTLTPLTTYSEMIGNFVQDPDVKLQLLEDFSQYSLKYATRHLKLPTFDSSIPLKGISKSGKTFNNYIIGTLDSIKPETQMVYVRNCENKNWLLTNPPTADHITNDIEPTLVDEESEESDDEHDSNKLKHSVEIIEEDIAASKEESDNIEEESIEVNIFDDDFADEMDFNNDKYDTTIEENHSEIDVRFNLTKEALDETIEENTKVETDENSYDDDDGRTHMDPDKIDRTKIIQELIEMACKKYKIPLPKNSSEEKAKKRKNDNPEVKNCENMPKKRKCESRPRQGEIKNAINNLISAYYKNLDQDLLHKISEHVRNVMQSVVDESNLDLSYEPQNTINADTDTNQICDKPENEIEVDISNENNQMQDGIKVDDAVFSDNDEDVSDADILRKINPDFDENIYDIKQLYVKVDGSSDVEDVFDVNDALLEEIIDKKIEEIGGDIADGCDVLNIDLNEKDKDKSNLSDSDDDVPLIVLKEEKMYQKEKAKLKKMDFEPLLINRNVAKFNYWTRHYKAKLFVRNHHMDDKFEVEVKKNLPKSFVFVITECASVIDSPLFSLYKRLQVLEEMFMNNVTM